MGCRKPNYKNLICKKKVISLFLTYWGAVNQIICKKCKTDYKKHMGCRKPN